MGLDGLADLDAARVHFIDMPAGLSRPQILAVGELHDIFARVDLRNRPAFVWLQVAGNLEQVIPFSDPHGNALDAASLAHVQFQAGLGWLGRRDANGIEIQIGVLPGQALHGDAA